MDAQRTYREALEKLNDARSAEDVMKARAELVEYHGNYPEVKWLKPLKVTADEARDVLSSEPVAVRQFVDSLKSGISDDEFRNFIKENVQIIAEAPEYYSVYGLTLKGDSKIIAVSKGKPSVDRPSYEDKWKISCDDGILKFSDRTVVRELKSKNKIEPPFLLPSSSEMKTVVDVANRNNLTMGGFEGEVLKLIERHIAAGHESEFVPHEIEAAKRYNPVKGWVSPYRRVQFVAWYMRWLKEDLKLMPTDHELEKWYERADTLSQPVSVDDIDDGLSWLCIWEDRIRKRQIECARFLSEIPLDWVKLYREGKNAKAELRTIEGWKIMSAGMIRFDPVDPNFTTSPDAIAVRAPDVEPNHPLYVLRKIDGNLELIRAFEPGVKAPWRKCAAMQRMADGYLLGEPLYHVFAKGKFIDVQAEFWGLRKRLGHASKIADRIPLFGNGGN